MEVFPGSAWPPTGPIPIPGSCGWHTQRGLAGGRVPSTPHGSGPAAPGAAPPPPSPGARQKQQGQAEGETRALYLSSPEHREEEARRSLHHAEQWLNASPRRGRKEKKRKPSP